MKSFLFIETMHASSEIIISAAIYQRFKPIISSYSGESIRSRGQSALHLRSSSLSLSLSKNPFLPSRLLTAISIFARSIRHEIFSFHFVTKQVDSWRDKCRHAFQNSSSNFTLVTNLRIRKRRFEKKKKKKSTPFPSTFIRKPHHHPFSTRLRSAKTNSSRGSENPKLTWSEGNKQKCLRHSSPIVVGHFLTRARRLPLSNVAQKRVDPRDTSRRFEYYVYTSLSHECS